MAGYNLSPKSYTITVRQPGRGRKIVSRHEFTSYDSAMDKLDVLERCFGHRYEIDFKTNF